MPVWRLWWLLLCTLWMTGCQSLSYVGHVSHQQWQIYRQRQPLLQVLHNPETAPRLATQLQAITRIRDFAATLGLPIQGQFDTYADIHRDSVMWSVTATPELSFQPQQWCVWGLACQTFRSYFEEQLATREADYWRQRQRDVYVGRVAAYSTFGWFRDPVLSSYVYRREAELAELIFHELAHQVVHADNDARFNESFAETVANEALRRYLQDRPDELARIATRKQREQQFVQLVLQYRARLQNIYQSPLPQQDKRQQKQQVLDELQQAYQRLKNGPWQGYAGYDAWFAAVNNASLNGIAVYNEWVPAFTALLAQQGNDLPAFYAACRQLARLPRAERNLRLGAVPPSTR